jgi:hypothetical protein
MLQSRIEKIVQQELRNIKLSNAGITQKVIEEANQDVDAQTFSLDDEGKRNPAVPWLLMWRGMPQRFCYTFLS